MSASSVRLAFEHLRPRRTVVVFALVAVVGIGFAGRSTAQSPNEQMREPRIDEEYTRLIREITTEPFFMTPLVDHLPESDVPTPLDHFGVIAGATDILHYPEEIYGYMRAVAAASDRVEVLTIGESEEGREHILVIVADAETLANIDQYKENLRRLGDPRNLTEAEAQELIGSSKPIYWVTGSIHSTETGSPEMLMELVYRLATGESAFIREIRDKLTFMTMPVTEVDGRAKEVDVVMAPRIDPDGNYPTRLLYWGEYVAHDNNRDGMSLSLKLSQIATATFLEYQPTVFHDLHESASHLYISTGRGPYNAWIDPIVISEWNTLAYKEVKDMTAFGVPGVYTYDYYDGWAPNYMFWVAHLHNSIGRFYETQGSGNASTRILRTNVDRSWSRPNTPLRETVWNIRNNNNLQQSALLIGLNNVATNKEEFLHNYWLKSVRSVAKATTEGPAAYVFPVSDPRPGQQARLLSLLQRHGFEVHRAEGAFSAEGNDYGAGSYIVRMDQPYSRGADMLLDVQYYNPLEIAPYDDVGWTHGPLYNVETVRVEDPAILDLPMTMLTELATAPASLSGVADATAYVVNYNADNNLTSFRFANPDIAIEAAEASFEIDGETYNAGSFVIPVQGNPDDLRERLGDAVSEYRFKAVGVPTSPDVPTHPVRVPRIAVMHTWQTTQTEGWIRVAFDEVGVPYDYISVHEVRDNPNLIERYDAIIFGPSSGNALSIVNGLQGNRPMPWMKTEVTPNLGAVASTEDMRGGLGLEGVVNLKNFIEAGGLFITIGNSASLPTHFGLAGNVSIRATDDLWARGGVFRAQKADRTSPLGYGYGDELGVYFNSGPVLALGGGGRRGFGGGRGGRGRGARAEGDTTAHSTGRGPENIIQGRPRDMGEAGAAEFRAENPPGGGGRGGRRGGAPTGPRVRTVFRFPTAVDELLISGGLMNGQQMTGAPALVDAPLGDGHVVLFSFNPFWRSETLGSYALVFNALMHFDNLDAGVRRGPATEEGS